MKKVVWYFISGMSGSIILFLFPFHVNAQILPTNEAQQLNIAARRLSPPGVDPSGCEMGYMTAYLGISDGVQCGEDTNTIQRFFSNQSVTLARALLPPDQFFQSQQQEPRGIVEKIRYWLFRTLITKTWEIFG